MNKIKSQDSGAIKNKWPPKAQDIFFEISKILKDNKQRIENVCKDAYNFFIIIDL